MSADSPLRNLIFDLALSADAVVVPGELPKVWSEMVKLGLDSVGVPESRGGSGGTVADLRVLLEALGQKGIGVPLIEAATAEWILASAGEDIGASGLALVVVTDATVDEGNTVSTTIRSVRWARSAEQLILYPAAGAPLRFDLRDREISIEPGRNLAGEQCDTVTLEVANGTALDSAPARGLVVARLGILWSAAIVGAVRGTYELTRDYVRSRAQFGAPLIQIPAVAAGLATIRTQLLQAETALNRAVEIDAAQVGTDPLLSAVAVARIVSASSASEAARLGHQLHGAMGVTNEYPLHRLTTRLWAWRDAVVSERTWSRMLGDTALAAGEDALWREVTANG